MRIGEDRMSWLPSLLNPNARVRLTTRALTTLLGTSSFAVSEEAYIARHQFIDFAGAGYRMAGRSIGTDENMDHLYVLHQPTQNVNSYNVEIWPRVIFYGQTGYTPAQDVGPLNCSFEIGATFAGDVTASPDGRWLAVSDQEGFGQETLPPSLYESTWDNMTNRGYVIDLAASNRSCSPLQLHNLHAFHGADAVFSGDSKTLLFGVPYAGDPPTDTPIWGRTVGQIRRHSLSNEGSWSQASNIRLFIPEAGLNQNAGMGKSVVASRDGSVIAVYAESLRIKESENGGEYVQTQFGYIPEANSRTPNYPTIAIVADDSYQYLSISLDNPEEYHTDGRTGPSGYYTGQQLAIADDGKTVVTIYKDLTRDYGGPGPGTKIQTLTSDADGTYTSETQTVDFRKCIDPNTDGSQDYPWGDPYDLALSGDGDRLAVLTMSLNRIGGVCLLTRENNGWVPLADASRALSATLTDFSGKKTTAEIIANRDLSRILIHYNNSATQADIEWSSGANGLPIWLLYEASRAGD